jgi:hypothetical protein
MPEIARFFGIIIRMFAEPGGKHHVAHFHAYYQNDIALYSISPVDSIAGSLPRRQDRFVKAWAELHEEELMADWAKLQAGLLPEPIRPLA